MSILSLSRRAELLEKEGVYGLLRGGVKMLVGAVKGIPGLKGKAIGIGGGGLIAGTSAAQIAPKFREGGSTAAGNSLTGVWN